LSEGSQAGEGRWARGRTLVGDQDIIYLSEAEALAARSDDTGLLPPPDPKLFATYDGSQGPGKPGDAAGGVVQGVENVITKVKDTLT
jgi:Mn-containing catalase